VEPLCSLLWSCKLSGPVSSVAWSPSNCIAACFRAPGYVRGNYGYSVQVWDSIFHTRTVFKRKQCGSNNGLSFPSDDLVVCSVSSMARANLYVYNVPKSKVTTYRLPGGVCGLTALSSEIVVVSCSGSYIDDMLYVYKVQSSQLQLLGTLSHRVCVSLASCVYPDKDAGCYMLASTDGGGRGVCISVIGRFNRHWEQKVKKIVLSGNILPFCRDVHKIIFKYL